MKTLRFINKDRSKFASTLRKNVNDYFKEKNISTKGDWKIILKSIVMMSTYLAPFIIMLILPFPGWVIFPLSVLIGIGMAGVGMSVMHDAAHGSSSQKSWLNKLLAGSMYTMGSSVFTWKVQHNVMHHTFTNIDGFDEDIDPRGSIRLSKQSPLKKVHRFQHIYAFFLYGFMTILKLFKEFHQLHQYNKTGVTVQQNGKPKWEFTKLVGIKLLYFAVFIGLPLLFSSFSWWLILLGFFVTHFTTGFILATVFQLAHVVEGADQPVPDANGNVENEWYIHQLQTTSDFAPNNRVLGYYIGGLNFQIEHHLFPHISHIHYPKISRIVERTAKEFGLTYNLKPSFIKAVGSHLRTLKALGRN